MVSTRVQFSVGLFMTAGLALATVAIIWLGMSSFLDKGQNFVTYFDESVQGLGVDSPVKYRGVPVGRVSRIRIAPDYHLIEVVILIEDQQSGNEDRFADCVASIANVGITGAMFVEIDKRRPGAPDLSPKLSFDAQYPVIASKPSDIKKLFREIDEIASKIQGIDFKGISDQAMAAFKLMNSSINEAQIGTISADVRKLLASINAAASKERLESMAKNTDQAILATRQMMEKAKDDLTRMDAIVTQLQGIVETNRPHINTTMAGMASTVMKADAFMEQSHATMFQMQSTIKDFEDRLMTTTLHLEQTSSTLNQLIGSLKDQPSQIIFAEPKAPRKID